jgi:hypothetical protein
MCDEHTDLKRWLQQNAVMALAIRKSEYVAPFPHKFIAKYNMH